MIQILLINHEIEWSRKLKFEEERRKSHRFQPFLNYLAPVSQPTRKEQKSQAPASFITSLNRTTFYAIM